MIISLLKFVVSLGAIMASLWLGTLIQVWLHLSIPGSVLGMLILFIALASGLLPVSWVKPGASLFIRYMVFLFVPISVGLMTHFDTLIENALPIFASAIGGTIIVLICMGLLLDRMLKKEHH
ncbi:CidA/LrgA family protein [Vibrio spartinae]|uniref:Holin-like protein CidA n=2 Tax=Vibrio spartinae TaxID=1918945 RepID=A0ABX6QZR0_9VIBR|nr:CidA/LrgA family protein [Vibrio spartinae]QMV14748.1 Holin-like protein CidA [Vibrio spartinae]